MKRAANVAAAVGLCIGVNLATVGTVEARKDFGHTVKTTTKTVKRKAPKQPLPHPPGCPATNYCGCGTAFEVFGKAIRELFLAANWFKFPPAKAAPGMIAVRNGGGHVFKIEKVLGPNTVLARNHNGKGHKSFIQVMTLAGYSVRNPKG